MKLAFLGLGKMGTGMATRLVQAGFDVCVYNRTIEKCDPLKAIGAQVASTPAEAVINAGIIFTMLADDTALAETMSRENFKKMLPDAIHVSMGTISTAMATQMAESHAKQKRGYLSCPVFGRPDAAAAGRLLLCLSGDPVLKERVQPYLSPMGEVWNFGESPVGANVIKLAGNFMICSTVELLSEAFSLVEGHGMAPMEFARFITTTLFSSPVFQLYSRLILDANFDDAGFTARLAAKDMGLVRDAAKASHTPMALAAIVENRFLSVIAKGQGKKDMSIISHAQREDAGLIQDSRD
jgi:3-hydroxyisobutyrate dehydrogenase-like beta-hydroxyacid dehydrogenase